jgi:hypothetical protein
MEFSSMLLLLLLLRITVLLINLAVHPHQWIFSSTCV